LIPEEVTNTVKKTTNISILDPFHITPQAHKQIISTYITLFKMSLLFRLLFSCYVVPEISIFDLFSFTYFPPMMLPSLMLPPKLNRAGTLRRALRKRKRKRTSQVR